ncbi:uncharacterized protein LOC116286652 [Actinia tenebrosa]|uniref:Uncharacterized protein LOC116286652 n=1 Tax=Actinia tenebrosa TaxID=6105 RepID=A0A6P8H9D1_ACTTE|nr:uncharacterized protein LOC116286652 [Actinia tenebrosa]
MMLKIRIIFLGLFLVCCLIQVCSRKVIMNGFQSHGSNVCRKTIIVNEPVSVFKVSHFRDNRQTSCGIFGLWRCTKSRIATRSKYVIQTVAKPVDSLYCCYGWKATVFGNSKICNKPICRHGCKHGKCVGADKCKCFSGWSGYMCERDVNECYQSNGNCQHVCTNTPGSYVCGCRKGYIPDEVSKNMCIDLDECANFKEPRCECANGLTPKTCGAGCMNTIGNYRCSCGKGYRLIHSTLCADIDECLSPVTNNCKQRCYNTLGSYSCDCMRGLRLSEDGTKCKDINECSTINGGCSQICLNAYGTFRCRCRLGFKLHTNRRRCIDVDECSLVTPCQMQCNNILGGYFCSCPKGYALNNDKFRCSDIDECVRSNDCEQLCANTVGSYICSCKRGFRLQSSGKVCIDVDECKNGAHKCDQNCHNVIGSYACSCGHGYRLNADKRTCRALPCESIENPVHGSMKCNGFSTGSKCFTKCDSLYDLFGSRERTCLSSGKWDGTKTVCKVKRCTQLSAPENAEVVLPCKKVLNSRCSLECEKGLYRNKLGIAACVLDSSSEFAVWNLNNFTCSKLKFCQPNPCRHGGKCVVQGEEGFFCNCEDTGFEGPQCETGIITTPTYQRLKVNKESKAYYLYARPEDKLTVTIRSTRAILVKPQSELRISKLSRQAAFTLTPKKPGLHIIAYTIDGQDAKFFKAPEENTIFVGPDSVSKDNVYNRLQISEGNLPEGCHELPKSLFQCNARLTSTFPWGTPSATSTEGIVHLRTKSLNIPISLFGASLNELSFTREQLLSKIEETSLQNVPAGSDLSFVRDGKCHSTPMKKNYLFEFIQNDALPKNIFKSLSSVLPQWIELQLDQSNDVFDVTNLMVSVGKPMSDGSGMCEQLPISPSSIFFEPSIAFTTKIGDDTKAFKSKERVCLALDVCQSKTFVGLSSKARKKFHQIEIFRDMDKSGWNFSISSLGIQDPSAKAKDSHFDVWMKSKTQVRISGPQVKVAFNISGNIFMKSGCASELFSRQFTCKLSGSAKGMIQMNTLLKIGDSHETLMNFNSKIISGKFVFGGEQEKQCPKKHQGIELQLESSKNPLQGSRLSPFIFPFRNSKSNKYAMDINITHSIKGGGKTDIRIPPGLIMKLKVLGYAAKEIYSLNIHNEAPELSADGAELQKYANSMNTLVTIAKSIIKNNRILKNKKARHFENIVKSLKNQIEKILTLMSTLSLRLKAAIIKNQLEVLKSDLDASKSLDYDAQRSPVIQNFNGISIGMLSQVCVGWLCVLNVRAKITANNDATSNSCQTKKSKLALPKNNIVPSLHLSPSRNVQLGRLFQIKKGEIIQLDALKKSMRFKAMVTLFGMKKVVILNITNHEVKFRAKGNIFNKFESVINVTAYTSKVDDWDLLVFNASGKMGKGSQLPRMLENSINQYAIILVQRADNRIKRAKKLLEDKIAKLQDVTKLVKSTLGRLNEARNKTIHFEKLEKQAITKYAEYSEKFDDVFLRHAHQIEQFKNATRCNLIECKPECKNVCVPGVCWERANVTYQKQDCFTVNTMVPKLFPTVISYMVDYMTTPTIRRDVGKCKSFVTAFLEGTITSVLSFIGLGRKKRSLQENLFLSNNASNDQFMIPDFNEYLKAENPKLPSDFDINVELRKQIPNLPKNFSMNMALRQYILRRNTIDVNKILKEYFPALSPDFDVNKILDEVVPEFKKSFNFDTLLRDVVLETQRLKKPIDFEKVIRQAIPQMGKEVDLDRFLKMHSPVLRSIENITKLIQKNLNDMTSFKLNTELLKTFDIAKIIKSKLHGTDEQVKQLQNVVLNLVRSSNFNSLITDAFKSNFANLDDIDLNQLIGSVMGENDFDLHTTLKKHFAGFERGLNLERLIKAELRRMITVDVNSSRLGELRFENMIRSVLPMIKNFDVNRIFATAFPNLERKFDVNEILKNAIPVLKMFGDVDINSVISGLSPNLANFDIDKEMKTKVPALRGGPEIGRLISEKLKDQFSPKIEKLLNLLLPVSLPNVTDIFKSITGEDGLNKIQKLVDVTRRVVGVFSGTNMTVDGLLKNMPKVLGNLFPEKVKEISEDLFGVINAIPNGLGFSMAKGFVNAIANSGCNHKYVEESGSTEALRYEQKIPILDAINVVVREWHCSNSRPVSITSNGFHEPKHCCRKDIKCVKIQDPNCLSKIQTCLNVRKIYFNIEQSLLGGYSAELKDLQSAEEELIRIQSELTKAKLSEQTAFQAHQPVDASRKKLIAQVNTKNNSLSKLIAIPGVRLGLKIKTIFGQPFRISSLSFHTVTSSLSKSRLPLKGTVTTKDGPDLTFKVIMDFKDVSLSIEQATKSVIKKLAQSIETSRKRRSISANLEFSNAMNVSEVLEHDKCVMAQNASHFFRDILISLRRLLDSKYTHDRDIAKELNSLHEFRGPSESSSSEAFLVNSYNELISLYKAQRRKLETTSWNEIINDWKNFVENMTEIRHMKDCAGAIDCVEEFGEVLDEMYKPLKSNAQAKEIRSVLLKLVKGIKELLEEDVSTEEAKSKLPNLLLLLSKMNDWNILCGEKPKMLSTQHRKIKRLIGESITIPCNVKSQTKVIYTWRKDNTILKVSDKSDDLELRLLNETSQGLYRCEAANHKGSTFSGITALVIQKKPTIVEHPTDVQVPLNKQSGVTFSCVASAKPLHQRDLPNIAWFFQPFFSKWYVELTNENGNLLYVVPDKVEKGGYYYCEASIRNERMNYTAASRKARLDVLKTTPSNPKIAVIFNATNGCVKLNTSCKVENVLHIPTRMDITLKNHLINLVTTTVGVPIKSISNMKYIPISKSIARIFFYVSDEIRFNQNDQEADEIVEVFADARLNLVRKLKRLTHALNGTVLTTANPRASVIGLANTLELFYVSPECPLGQYLDDNGYMCVQCPPGKFKENLEGECKPCPIGTYQPKPGQVTCLKCDQDKTTLQRSTIEESQCIEKA